MPKRKNDDVTADDEDDETNSGEKSTQQKQQQQPPQKVYDFHKKTIEVYPQRLLELNRQFVASITSQVEAEEYSVLVGNCLDYVRQYFNYEDDLLQYSPWLVTRLKQSRSDIVKCLQETIDVYEALAHHDFDRIIEKSSNGLSSDDTTKHKTPAVAQSSSTFQFRPAATTASSSSVLSFPKATTTTATTSAVSTTASDTTVFSFGKTITTTASSSTLPSTSFTFSKPPPTTTTATSSLSTTTTTTTTTTGFNLSKPATTIASDSLPSSGFIFSKPITATTPTTTSDLTPSTGFSFKLPSASTSASPDNQTSTSPFAFSIPSTGFGTSTFNSPSFGTLGSAEKTSTGSASSISFASPPKFAFGSTPAMTADQPATGDDNEDEPGEPPEPEKVEHEADAKLTYRCRMGVVKLKENKLIKRGPVQVVLKESNGKHQLIIRSDDALGRLYLNILWAKPIEATKNSSKDLTFVCAINPGMPEIKEGEFGKVLLRFDNETDRNDAHDKLNKEL
ncbi:unnamed protein product [Adineta ricciae]|uniref:RanBD1 domain-containing protein n=1 Tax=Adineta ricciae TaxID=249248 RepID=A0A814EQU4_ADIRI|nr:unnamed protein product [Adineta ricciae]